MKGRARGRRAMFWVTVALVAVSADVAVNIAAKHVRSPGLARLTQHMGGH